MQENDLFLPWDADAPLRNPLLKLTTIPHTQINSRYFSSVLKRILERTEHLGASFFLCEKLA